MAAESYKQSLREVFGEASVEKVEQLVVSTCKEEGVQPEYGCYSHDSDLLCALPQGAVFLLGGLVEHLHQYDGAVLKAERQLRANACAVVTAFTGPTWTAAAISAFGQRMLQLPESELKLLEGPGGKDYAALCFIATVVHKNMSAHEVAHALREEPQGQQCLETFRTSPTLGPVVLFAAYSLWDDLWNWLRGSAEWVKDSFQEFGELATKSAKAVVHGVFYVFHHSIPILEQIPGVGLMVAAVYAIDGKSDNAWAALAVNLNVTVNFIGAGVGAAIGGPAGGLLGGALGKTVGILLEQAIAKAIQDPHLRTEVGDISATRFIVEVALGGAVAGGAGGIAKVLAEEAGMSAVARIGTSQTLTRLLATLPLYIVPAHPSSQ